MDDITEFERLDALAEELVEHMSKHEVAQCARLLALHLADYTARVGRLPAAERYGLLATIEVDRTQAPRLRAGAQVLLSYLSRVREPHRDGDDGH